MTLKSLIYRISCGFTNYSLGLAHALGLFSRAPLYDVLLRELINSRLNNGLAAAALSVVVHVHNICVRDSP